VRNALINPTNRAVLQRIATSPGEAPVSYNRNADYASPEITLVLQHLLGVARSSAISKANAYADNLAQLATIRAQEHTGRPEQLRMQADSLRRYARLAPQAPKLDGDFGPASHKARGFITIVENTVTGGQFPHVKVDSRANDTAIGPKTLRLLLDSSPQLGYIIDSDPTVFALSVAEYYGKSQEPSKGALSAPGSKAASKGHRK
jgi:hypothetical protein